MPGIIDDGYAAYRRGDYATAMSILHPFADKGSVLAQLFLGLMYFSGKGVPQDYGQAVFWFRKAADQGEAVAQSMLGNMYAKGEGVPQDYSQAAAWFHKAADQGDALAQDSLGVMYSNGEGVLQDYVLAHMWFNLAALHAKTAGKREVFVAARDALSAKMTPGQIAEAQKMAREWKPK